MSGNKARFLAILIAIAIVATSCGSGKQTVTTDGSLPFGLHRCSGLSWISADPSFYRDEPTYVGNEQPTEKVRAWALGQPGYEGIWLDRDHRGWITVGFSSDADARQSDLEAKFPGVGVVAAAVEHTASELEQLRDEVFSVMLANDMGVNGASSVPSGLVSASVGVLDEATLAVFADFRGRPVCFDGADPVDAVADGPQPTSGDGWRLLAVERTGNSYRTGAASTDPQYTALWAESGVSSRATAVNFHTEIVIWFGAVYGSGCEIRMDGVVFDTEREIVHGDFVIPGNPVACNDDANAEAYLVAVDRVRLPAGPFAIQLNDTDPPSGVPEERTLISVDLSAPGASASNNDIGPDPRLFEQTSNGHVIDAGDIIEPGYGVLYRLDLSCGFELVGPINHTVWKSDNAEIDALLAEPWTDATDADGYLLVEVLLETNPPTLSVSLGDRDETYHPAVGETQSDCP